MHGVPYILDNENEHALPGRHFHGALVQIRVFLDAFLGYNILGYIHYLIIIKYIVHPLFKAGHVLKIVTYDARHACQTRSTCLKLRNNILWISLYVLKLSHESPHHDVKIRCLKMKTCPTYGTVCTNGLI